MKRNVFYVALVFGVLSNMHLVAQSAEMQQVVIGLPGYRAIFEMPKNWEDDREVARS
jgi:hypothetical protein